MPAQPNVSLINGLACLQELVAADAPIGSRVLARRLGLEPTRVNRLLGTLAQLGLAEQDAERKYRPGPGVHVLAAQSLRGSRLLRAALPVIRTLDAGGGRVALGVLWRDQVCYLYHGDPRRPLEAGIGGHELYPADQSSIGAVLRAAQAPASDVAAAAVRVQGHALLRAGRGNASLAVPVGTPAIAGLALFGTGVDSARAPALAAMLGKAAALIAAACAGKP